MDTTFHLHWMRESGAGHLDADLGTAVPARELELAIIGLLPEQQPGKIWGRVKYEDLTTPWRLPEWSRQRVQQFFGGDPVSSRLTLLEGFCNRIRDKAWNLEQIGLFLPYFGRRDWIERFSTLPDLAFELTSDGVVAEGMKPNSIREIAMRTAAGVFAKSQTAVPIRFESRLPLIDPWRALLLDRYGLELPIGAPALARFTMESTGAELTSWTNTPRERHCHYYGVFSRLALTIQYALRRWTLATFALGPNELADFDSGADVLVYSAVRPHAEKRGRDFSYDVLNGEMMDFAFGRAARRLEPLLQNASDMLLEAGREDDARLYLKRDLRLYAPRLAQRARRRSRVRMMLVSEGVLIYSMMKFANRLKSLDSARAVTHAVDELARDFDERIRKMFFFLDKPEEFGTMVFLEASNAIHCAMGGTQSLSIQGETADGARHSATRPMAESCPSI